MGGLVGLQVLWFGLQAGLGQVCVLGWGVWGRDGREVWCLWVACVCEVETVCRMRGGELGLMWVLVV